jgi:hypothetical protein
MDSLSPDPGGAAWHDIDLQLDAFLSNIAHADATLCTYPPRVALIRHQLPLGFDVKGRCDIPPKRSDSDIATLGTILNRRFAPPWSIEDIGTAYVVKDGGGRKLAYIHYEDEAGGRRRRCSRKTRRGGCDGLPRCQSYSSESLVRKPEMIGTTRSRVSFFMNKFRKLGYIEYNGNLEIRNSLLNVVLYDKPEIRKRGVSEEPR